MIFVLLKNILFELNIRRKQASTYVYFILFFSLGLIATLALSGAVKGVVINFGLSNKVLINSPMSLNILISLIGGFGLFIISPIFGQAIYKDYGANIEQIIFSTSANRKGFLLGRFLGAFLTLIFIFSGIAIGIWIATLMPTVQHNLIGTNYLKAYLLPYATGLWPNIFIFGSIFFLLVSKTKKMAPAYIAGILIFMGWMLAGQLMADLDNKLLTSLLDPFGLNAIIELTKYWSANEQNTQYITLSSYYLYNRLLWGGIGLICFLWSLLTFKESQKFKKSSVKEKVKENGVHDNLLKESSLLFVTPDFSFLSQMNMFFKQMRFELGQVFKSIYFRVILLAGILYIFIVGNQVGKIYGTTTYPVTYKILDVMGTTFDLFILIILTFYAGEAVWRERNNRINQIIDAFPTPSWVSITTKYFSLLVTTGALLLVLMVCGIITQTFKGYNNYEFGLYFKHIFLIKFITFANIAALALFLQTMLNSKYLGHGAMILYYILYTWMPSMGFSHKIYRFNAAPLPVYSDMNEYGRFLEGYLSFKVFWLIISFLMLISVFLFWQRGVLTDWKERLKESKRRLGKSHVLTSLALLIVGIFLGTNILYNTNYLNSFETSAEKEANRYEYEKEYKQYEFRPELKIISVKAHVDIFPYQAKIKAKIYYKLKNKSQQPIKELFISAPSNLKPSFEWSVPAKQTHNNKKLGVIFYTFNREIAPGEELELLYSVDVDRSSFPNGSPDSRIVQNGTFFSDGTYFPVIGYQKDSELFTSKTRVKYGLKPKKRMPPIHDKHAHQYTYISNNANWIDFEAIVSTSSDQIAIAPGYLIKEWSEGRRKYFHYKMDQKILNFYSFLSGKYKVKRDKWKNVNIEIYHHAQHNKNIDRMIEATKASLDYFTKNFGPYQHKQFRIIEFPRYSSFAQAFPNTVPFSESSGFIAKVENDNPKDIDYPFYVTAHELAHQWWAHQVIGAGVQGATVMSETFSQYSALMVMKKKYGKNKIKRFLKYELDGYLNGRSKEHEKELPLYLNENQGYIHYRKGSLIMYALQDYIGEDTVNDVLKSYIKKVAFQEAPFTTSLEFLEILKSKTNAKYHPLIDDMFKKIVLFENKPLEAKYKKLEDGSYQVSIKISSKKYYVDEDGREEKTSFSQAMYVGIENKKGDFLYLAKQTIQSGENEITISVKEKPYKANVDPLNILIDKNPDDNHVSISEKL